MSLRVDGIGWLLLSYEYLLIGAKIGSFSEKCKKKRIFMTDIWKSAGFFVSSQR
jgi:hypothetical protein